MKSPSWMMVGILIILQTIAPSEAGIVLSATRVILEEGAKESSIIVKNGETDLMLQSWISADPGSRKIADLPMTVAPPLAKLRANKQQLLRVMYQGQGLAQDTESILWLNVQEIPQRTTEVQNTLQMAMLVTVKVFYRPKGIVGSPLMAAKELVWQYNSGKLSVKNPSNYHITLIIPTLGGYQLAESYMLAPHEEKIFEAKGKVGEKLSYKVVNDFGGEDDYHIVALGGEPSNALFLKKQ